MSIDHPESFITSEPVLTDIPKGFDPKKKDMPITEIMWTAGELYHMRRAVTWFLNMNGATKGGVEDNKDWTNIVAFLNIRCEGGRWV